MTSTESGRIWVGCLASYNSGILHGKWFPAADIREGIAEVLKTSPTPGAEEWFIADYDAFPNLGEYPSIESVEGTAEALDTVSNREAFIAYASFLCLNLYDHAAASDFEEAYCGVYDSLADFAEQHIEECYGESLKALPDFLRYRIDWQGVARDFECSGDYFTCKCPDGGVFVFSSF